MASANERAFELKLRLLARPEAFPFAMPPDQTIPLIQTHASAVLLAGDYAYKLKKPRDFGFFDYSTPARRRYFCIEEVRLNVRLAPDVYLGVAPIVAVADGSLRFGPPLGLDDVPQPGAVFGESAGQVEDFAVVMRRLPDEAMLATHVAADTATPTLLAAVAHRVAAFHKSSATSAHIARFGSREVIAGNWEENFAQMRPYIGRALDGATFDRIVAYVRSFIERRSALFARRVSAGCIRDCHGDLRLQHVYLLSDRRHGTDDTLAAERIAIIDCIEFNERFRYSDVAAEVAFLAMELDAAARPDLARAFMDAYVKDTGDDDLRELLPFYVCYRACVRGKVLAFQLDEPEIPDEQRELARQQAAALFALAGLYASGPTQPMLLLVGGVMGTGKSTLANALHAELGWIVLSSDDTRKRLAQRDVAQPDTSAFGEGIYSHDWTVRTYAALLDDARATLSSGRSVILDATYSSRAARQQAAQAAVALGARAVFVECVCPEGVALKRLGARWRARIGQRQPQAMASGASDGRPDLYAAQRAAWQPFEADLEPGLAHLRVATDVPLARSTAAVLDELEVPRLASWLALFPPR